MGRSLGQQVVIENITGAGGSIAVNRLVQSAPDGYTVGFISNSLPINAALQPKLPYDTDRDFIMGANEAKEYGIVDEVISNRELAAVPVPAGVG